MEQRGRCPGLTSTSPSRLEGDRALPSPISRQGSILLPTRPLLPGFNRPSGTSAANYRIVCPSTAMLRMATCWAIFDRPSGTKKPGRKKHAVFGPGVPLLACAAVSAGPLRRCWSNDLRTIRSRRRWHEEHGQARGTQNSLPAASATGRCLGQPTPPGPANAKTARERGGGGLTGSYGGSSVAGAGALNHLGNPTMSPDQQACPFCGETILSTAKKCRHCGEWLEVASGRTGSGPGVRGSADARAVTKGIKDKEIQDQIKKAGGCCIVLLSVSLGFYSWHFFGFGWACIASLVTFLGGAIAVAVWYSRE